MSCLRRVGPTLVLLLAGLSARADNWPQWRGPTLDGVSKETGLPARWTATENVVWKLKLPGVGGSTPVVWDDRVLLTSEDGDAIVLLCVGTDGKVKWKKAFGKATPHARTDEGNGASATPSTDGKHVWAFAGSGELACFDLDGKEVWMFNLQDRYGRFDNQYGIHSTPVLHKDRLYLQLIHDGAAVVVALEKGTGKEVWKVERKSDGVAENKHSYASPSLWQKGDDAYLITHGNDYTIGHRLEDGKEIWRVTELNPKAKYNPTLRFVATPVATPELIVVPSAKNGAVVAVKPDAAGTVSPGSKGELWRKTSGTPDVPCPLVHDGLVYICRENQGILTVLDAKTGQQVYSERIYADRYRASPVYADGKIYLSSRKGVVTVVKAGRTFEKLAENRLPDQMSASPAVANGRIYLRGFETLYCIGAAK